MAEHAIEAVTPAERERLAGHAALCVWFTGLPAAGKTTLARGVERRLHARGIRTFTLDGDELRQGLTAGLGFTPAERSENLRRAAFAARLLVEAGVVVLCAFVSPAAVDRARARALFAPGRFIEVFVRCPLEVCRARDPKGHYRQAERGELPDFTGVGAPYETPAAPELVVDSSAGAPSASIAELEQAIVLALGQQGLTP